MAKRNEGEKSPEEADIEWCINILHESGQSVLPPETIDREIEYSKKLKEARLESSYNDYTLISQTLSEGIDMCSVTELRRLLRIWEYANNPHRTYNEKVLLQNLNAGMDSEKLQTLQKITLDFLERTKRE